MEANSSAPKQPVKLMEQGGAAADPPPRRRKIYKNPCLISIAVLLTVVIIILILAFTVFKAKRPITKIDSVAIDDFSVSLDLAKLGVSLNVTLDVDVSVQNPNRVGFKYTNSSALLNYRGNLVGVAPIPAGQISGDQTVGMNITLTVMADRLLANSQLFSDVQAGILPLNTFTEISGKVKVVFLKIKVVSTTSCDFMIYISNRTVGDQDCKYKTKY